MRYVVRLDVRGGGYYKALGPGGDWTRASEDSATRFDTREEAERVARALSKFGADVEEEEE